MSEKKLSPPSKSKIGLNSQRLEVAAKLWAQNPEITIEDMIWKYEINLVGGESKNYAEKTLRNWIKDLCLNRSLGAHI